YYALRDTRTPLRFAVLRVALTTALGWLCAVPLPHWLGIEPRWGAAGLTASAGVAGWVEFALLRRGLNRRIGDTGLPFAFVGRLWSAALAGAAVGTLLRFAPHLHPVAIRAAFILVPFGLIYFAFSAFFGIEEGRGLLRRAGRLLRLSR
ncbi:MAG TPA: murein biosynthesis integral membrane protein MurJ, partial [Bryobacteraceae bacterium]|nr:murein biosynthesis integral membrane protein MurJ [Bryobacteraceae bacterium]